MEAEQVSFLRGSQNDQQRIVDAHIDMNKHSYLFALSLAVGNAADAVEIMCIGYIMNEIDGISTQEKEFLSAAVFIGMLVGGLLCGVLSDRIGRKPCLQYSLFINAVASLASAFAPSIPLLILCRVVGGIGIGGSVPSVFTLGAELFPSPIRGKLLSLIARSPSFLPLCPPLISSLRQLLDGWGDLCRADGLDHAREGF
jgi:MFS family permease